MNGKPSYMTLLDLGFIYSAMNLLRFKEGYLHVIHIYLICYFQLICIYTCKGKISLHNSVISLTNMYKL